MRIIKEKKPQTIKELIVLVKEQLQIPDQEIVESVLKLQSEGQASFVKQPPIVSPNLVAYLKTEQTRWFWATVVIVIATAAVMFTVPEDFYPFVYVRYVLGAIFVLWLPGYTFMRALFPTEHSTIKLEKDLDTIERVALSLGMSLALVPIVGLLLNYTPWGIRLTPIVLSLLALTMLFATAAIMRENQAEKKATTETLKEK
jgi:Na+/melibiose symporter-like transporter